MTGGTAERVILVDPNDTPRGTADKLEAHRTGQLHRAFSIFVVNRTGEVLLQRRARDKYHSGGLWSNTCCSHPRPGEETIDAANRRLVEEMGFHCTLERRGAMVYRTAVGPRLVEYEYDHLFTGRWDGEPSPDPAEVDAWRWVAGDDIMDELADHPRRFTPWFRPAFSQLHAAGLLPTPVGRVA